MNFNSLILLAGVAMATCPVDTLIRSAKMLSGNIVNAMNQKNLALLIGAIANEDATANAKFYNAEAGKCLSIENQPYAQFVSDALSSNIKFVQANITDAFQTHVGYTVVNVHALDDRGVYTSHQFNYMDPKGTCDLELIFWGVSEDRCGA